MFVPGFQEKRPRPHCHRGLRDECCLEEVPRSCVHRRCPAFLLLPLSLRTSRLSSRTAVNYLRSARCSLPGLSRSPMKNSLADRTASRPCCCHFSLVSISLVTFPLLPRVECAPQQPSPWSAGSLESFSPRSRSTRRLLPRFWAAGTPPLGPSSTPCPVPGTRSRSPSPSPKAPWLSEFCCRSPRWWRGCRRSWR